MKGHCAVALFALLVFTLLASPAKGAWLMILEGEEPAEMECPVQMRLVSLIDFDFDDEDLFACIPDDLWNGESADADYDHSYFDDDKSSSDSKHEGPYDGMPLEIPQFN